MTEYQTEATFNIYELFGLIRKNILLIIVITIITTVGTGLGTKYLINSKYESTTLISVTKDSVNNAAITSSDVFRYGTELAKRYSIIATSNSVISEVQKRLKNEYRLEITRSEIKNSVEVVSVNETDILLIKVKYSEPEAAKEIADIITDVSNNIYQLTYEDAVVKEIDDAEINYEPVSPNLKLNIFIGFVVGLFMSIGYVFLSEYVDRTIKDERDIEKYLDLTVVGSVPLFD